ncbi:MAG: hypothetical protein AAB152_11820 [Candidatus Coatesbacteria bacterium]
MAPRKPARRKKVRDLRRSRSFYPIGTRIADGYGLDLDREARDGVPGTRLGMPPEEPETVRFTPLHPAAVLALVAVVAGMIILLPHHQRPSPPANPEVTRHYADMRAAGHAGALAAGWVPSFVPAGATDIYERHNDSTSEGWLAFRFPPDEGPRMTDRFHLWKLSEGRLEILSVLGPPDAWWPDKLRGRIAVDARLPPWEIYYTGRCATGKPIRERIAVDWKNSRAYLWREAR